MKTKTKNTLWSIGGSVLVGVCAWLLYAMGNSSGRIELLEEIIEERERCLKAKTTE